MLFTVLKICLFWCEITEVLPGYPRYTEDVSVKGTQLGDLTVTVIWSITETRGRIHKEILSLRQKIVSALRFGLS